MIFELLILGSNSALPANGRHPAAQYLNIREKVFLIDCGEGTQMQMAKYGAKKSRIDSIFISHLHGDHVFGLAPLLSSYALNRRQEPLTIIGPPPIREFIDHQMECMGAQLPFELGFHEVSEGGTVFENEVVTVEALPLDHRISTFGYLFREKPRPPHILPEELEKRGIPYQEIPGIKKGEIVQDQYGEEVDPGEVTQPASPPRSFAYISDTRYQPALAKKLHGVDLLYHETTFLHNLKERAEITRHTTALEAGRLARKAQVDRLLIGHFSTRYNDLEVLREEAAREFDRVELAEEGKKFDIPEKSARS